jgi:tetratricopeptide (TPR) repeat protein
MQSTVHWNKKGRHVSNRAWQTVRVFVSSTFRDMRAERDHLARVVFPELRERMAKRCLHLVDLDLRWGVTEEEAEQGKVLDVILAEIDRARPFFVGLLGDRYGSLPDKIPEETEHVYPWLKDYEGCSYTSLEVVHGVLRNNKLTGRAFFFFRNSNSLEIPKDYQTDYLAENLESERKLANLKAAIKAKCAHVRNYDCCWDGTSNRVGGLQGFGEQVLEDLWTAICEEYPLANAEVDPIVAERQLHEAFVEERSYMHFGREAEAAKLTGQVSSQNYSPIVVTGESGCGKSAFLAKWYRQYSEGHPSDNILAYFIGASPDSSNHFHLLRNMCKELKNRFPSSIEIPEEDIKLSETLAVILNELKEKYRTKIIILLDGLDQLIPLEGTQGLGWLLNYVPSDVHLVFSSLEGDCLDILQRYGAVQIVLPPLTNCEQSEIVSSLLGSWGRKLDSKQLSLLLARSEAANPLYLRVALEELRLYGDFETLSQRISNLPACLKELFEQVMLRLEEDNGADLVKEIFSLIGCSRYGLSETELLDLLSEESQRIPLARWTRFRNSAKMYLVQRGELFSFFHHQLIEAVKTVYLSKEDKHAQLAEYFYHASPQRILDELPFQLQHAKNWQALASVLSNLPLLTYAWNRDRCYEWTSYWLSMENVHPNDYYKSALEEKIKQEGETANIANLSNLVGLLLRRMSFFNEALCFFETTLRIRETVLGSNCAEVGQALNNLGLVYDDMGKFRDACSLFQRAAIISEATLGSNHRDLALNFSNLANVYLKQGSYDESLNLLKKVLRIRETALQPNYEDVADSLNSLGHVYLIKGEHQEAISLLQRALKNYERTLSPNHPKIAVNLNNIAVAYQAVGNYNLALSLFERALRIVESVFGPNNLESAHYLNNISSLYHTIKQYSKAVLYSEKVLRLYETTLGPNHFEVAMALNNLATLYCELGKYSEAIPLYFRAIETYEAGVGPNHKEVANSLGGLASAYYFQGRYNDAIPLWKRAIEIDERVLGTDHVEVARMLNNLAMLYKAKGKYEEALHCLQKALKINQNVFGTDSVNTTANLHNIAVVYTVQRKFEEALAHYKQALRINEEVLGPNNLSVGDNLDNLALLYQEMGRYTEALGLFQRALKIREDNLGATHPSVAISLNNLGLNCFARGLFDEALPLYKRALEINETALGLNHPELATNLYNLGMVYSAKKEYEEALFFYKRALGIDEAALGLNHINVAMDLSFVARVYSAQGKFREALPLFQRALAIYENAVGSNHPYVASVLNNIAEVHIYEGRIQEAMILLQRALSINQSSFGQNHREVAVSLTFFAELYSAQGNYNEALKCYRQALEIDEKVLGPKHSESEEILRRIKSVESKTADNKAKGD